MIPNLCPFCSYHFWEKNFFQKNVKIIFFLTFWKIIKFSKYGTLTYYDSSSRRVSKKYLNNKIFEKVEFRLLTGKIVENVYNPIRKQHFKFQNFKFCTYKPRKSKIFALFHCTSYGFRDNCKFRFSRSCDLESHVTKNINFPNL